MLAFYCAAVRESCEATTNGTPSVRSSHIEARPSSSWCKNPTHGNTTSKQETYLHSTQHVINAKTAHTGVTSNPAYAHMCGVTERHAVGCTLTAKCHGGSRTRNEITSQRTTTTSAPKTKRTNRTKNSRKPLTKWYCKNYECIIHRIHT